ncbi:hypothetical protein WJX73_001631 [Symbiochloris irregularis]|uniref:Uncharacterized protein n=1 Tax=Symbiochloris irregularis TaxID=706552 RepID=A0AAW1NS60_9CHLO
MGGYDPAAYMPASVPQIERTGTDISKELGQGLQTLATWQEKTRSHRLLSLAGRCLTTLHQAGQPQQHTRFHGWPCPGCCRYALGLHLIAIAMSALEERVGTLPEEASKATAAEWQLLMLALLSSCSTAAAQAWLGYVPGNLGKETQTLIGTLRTGLRAEKSMMLLAADGAIQASSAQQGASELTRQSAKQPCSTGSGPESMQGDLWDHVAEKASVHAVVTRFLRFGIHGRAVPAASSADLDGPDVAAALSLPGFGARERARRALHSSASGIRGWGWQRSSGAVAPAGMPASPALRRGWAVLHDMAITAAELVASAYLAEAGSPDDEGQPSPAGGGQPSSAELQEEAWPLFLHPRLTSTRSLERFRNQVALRRLMQRNIGEVVDMHEDMHWLWCCSASGRLMRQPLPARRSQELRALKGWRRMVSLGLDLVDVAAPLIRAAFMRASACASWLLSTLIGRGLGLIFRGVRQSIYPGGQKAGVRRKPRQYSRAVPGLLQ